MFAVVTRHDAPRYGGVSVHAVSGKPHICFVAPHAWPVLAQDRRIQSVGGAEVQQSTLARALAKSGYRVSMICLDFGQPDEVEVDGVRVAKSYDPYAGLPALRFFYPRLTSVWAAMRRVNADVYYQRGAGVLTGWVAWFCRRHLRVFIYATASDADLDPDVPVLGSRRDRWIYQAGLRHAGTIVVQNDNQRQLCRRSLGREPDLIRSCYALPDGMRRDEYGYVLWVATLRNWKRPELLLDLAARLPTVRFRLVGGPDSSKCYAETKARAARLSNVEFLGFVPHTDIEQHFDGARLVVNTSDPFEGFPNTFLQAWARGIPTVSFISPADFLKQGPLPLSVRSFEEMAMMVETLMTDNKLWREAGDRVRLFCVNNHSVESAVLAYTQLIGRLGVPFQQQRHNHSEW